MTGIDVTRLLGVDPAGLSHADRVELLVGLQRSREAVEAAELRTLAVLAHADKSEKQWVHDEVACALSIACSTAVSRLHDAADLVELLPSTSAAVQAGDVPPRHARTLLELTRGLPAAVRAKVEKHVLPRAIGRTSAEFRRTVRRAVAAADPRGLEERHATAAAERRVVLRPAEDGMAELWALLPADGAARLMSTVQAVADGLKAVDKQLQTSGPGGELRDGNTRTADQRRADALISLCAPAGMLAEYDTSLDRAPGRRVGELGDGRLAGSSRGRISVHVTVPLAALRGGEVAGELAGHGPVPASMARRIATDPDALWRRIVTDPVAGVVDASRTYRPSAAQCERIRARDLTCRFPGCSRPARLAEIDHIVDWANDGQTIDSNLHCLCSRHHHLKHETEWLVHRRDDGTTTWRTPSGRTYEKPPDDTVDTYLSDRPPAEVGDPPDIEPPDTEPPEPTCALPPGSTRPRSVPTVPSDTVPSDEIVEAYLDTYADADWSSGRLVDTVRDLVADLPDATSRAEVFDQPVHEPQHVPDEALDERFDDDHDQAA